jgi:hypothetical protein
MTISDWVSRKGVGHGSATELHPEAVETREQLTYPLRRAQIVRHRARGCTYTVGMIASRNSGSFLLTAGLHCRPKLLLESISARAERCAGRLEIDFVGQFSA